MSHLGKSLKYPCGKYGALPFAAIHEQPSTLPHYCEISNLPLPSVLINKSTGMSGTTMFIVYIWPTDVNKRCCA
jgi:hypothetical protein